MWVQVYALGMSLALLEQVVGDLELSVDGSEITRLFAVADQLLARAFTTLDGFDTAGLWDIDGAISLPAWLVTHAGRSRSEAFSLARTLHRLRQLPVTFKALRTGVLTHAQVQVIVANISDRHVTAFGDAEGELIPLLAPLSITEITTAMRTWAARAHAAAVAAADADPNLPAEPKVPEHVDRVHLHQQSDGTWRGDIHLSAEPGNVVQAALRSLLTQDLPGEPVRVHSQKMADALVEMSRMIIQGFTTTGQACCRNDRHYDVERPEPGCGSNPGRDCVRSDNDSNDDVRREYRADTAWHRNEPLHYGSGKDFIPPSLYKRVLVRDRHCRFRGCDRPGIWTEVHHIKHRANNGPTDITNLALLCSRHHHLLHMRGWDATMTPDGVLTVTTPTNNTLVSHPPGHHYPLLG